MHVFRKAPLQDQLYSTYNVSFTDLTFTDSNIDYVIVYNNKFVNSNVSYKNKCDMFLNNLKKEGFVIDKVPFSQDRNIIFVKLFLPSEKAADKANQFDLDLQCDNYNYRPPYSKPMFRICGNELIYVKPGTKLYDRISYETYQAMFPVKKISNDGSNLSFHVKDVTEVEKLVIISNILSSLNYGISRGQVGIQKLQQQGIVTCHYPLHQGALKWSTTGKVNDRQLLVKYWSNLKSMIKLHPLGLIEKYLGPEVAFYFAWVQLYTRMLVPVSFLSLGMTLPGLRVFSERFMPERVRDYCYTDKRMCPSCDFRQCKINHLSSSCASTKISFILDNEYTVALAVIISIWSTLVIILWKRKEALHILQWNLQSVSDDTNMRPDYLGQTSLTVINPITEETEPLVSSKRICSRYLVSFITILLLVSVMVLAIFGVMMLRRFILYTLRSSTKQGTFFNRYAPIVATLTGALVSMIFLLIFQAFYRKLAKTLTDLENPRTQQEYDKSYTLKMFSLAFVNNYGPVLYIAFMKGKFYTNPADMRLYSITSMRADVCDPIGCIPDLGMQLAIILIGKKLPIMFQQFTFLRLQILFKKRVFKVTLEKESPQWEKDYVLIEANRYLLVNQYTEIIIQYGFVIFFISAFPIAPILALLNNLIENRVVALKFMSTYRRYLPRRVAGLDVWYDILKFMTFFGILTNALIMAFTSDAVNREIYKWRNGNYEGYIDTVLTLFKVDDFYEAAGATRDPNDHDVAYCYYKAMHYPYDHPEKYTHRHDYWEKVAKEFITVVSLEHIILALCGILAYALPSIPYSVKAAIGAQEEHIRDMQMQTLGGKAEEDTGSRFNKFRSYSYIS